MASSRDRQRPGNPPHTDLDWLAAHLGALYESNDLGRLTARRNPERGRPPRFVFARTRVGCLWRFGADEPAGVVRELARLAALEPPAAATLGPPPLAPDRLAPMQRVLEGVRPIERVWNGPVCRLTHDTDAEGTLEDLAADALVVDDPSDPLLAECASALGQPLADLQRRVPLGVSTFAGRVVAVCRGARAESTAWVHARVDTLPAARRHGHATRATAAWAHAIVRGGRLPLFAAAWPERGALGIARKLGLLAFAEVWSFD